MNMRICISAATVACIGLFAPFAVVPAAGQDTSAETELVRSQQAPANGVWLETLNLNNMSQDYGTPHRRKTVDNNPLTLGGVVYPHGVGTHAKSEIAIELKGGSNRFLAMVGLDDERKSSNGSVTFDVLGRWKENSIFRRNARRTAA